MDRPPPTLRPAPAERSFPVALTRRRFIAGASAGVFAAAGATYAIRSGVLGSLAGAASFPSNGHVLISVFMRFGADGLSIAAPVNDPRYHDLRPGIDIPASAGLGIANGFALHPVMTRLKALYDAGMVAVIPASGLPGNNRSHFEAQDAVDRARINPGDYTGWLGRHLTRTAGPNDPLRSFGFATGQPRSLRGSSAVSAPSLGSFTTSFDAGANAALGAAYAASDDPLLVSTGATTLAAMDEARSVAAAATPPPGWPPGGFARSLAAVKAMIEGGIPLEVACIDTGGWDTHTEMGSPTDAASYMRQNIQNQIDNPVGAFFESLGANASRVTMVMTSEFGRRVAVNSDGGTDHGSGGVTLVIGGGVSGGVKGIWPGLEAPALVDGDVAVSNDVRAVFAEVLAERMGNTDIAGTFPGATLGAASYLGVCA